MRMKAEIKKKESFAAGILEKLAQLKLLTWHFLGLGCVLSGKRKLGPK